MTIVFSLTSATARTSASPLRPACERKRVVQLEVATASRQTRFAQLTEMFVLSDPSVDHALMNTSAAS